ncbi:hypothetical protein NPIL_63331 [Nephila pilipes]|uniref:Uncharacterized protein n=1 Tax=Nephila pilipes TaxID=299642 RepID=A0A8X6MW29_NEPPI|nr:hypothetical protein NPIL_63331 [Nephila pilipes]
MEKKSHPTIFSGVKEVFSAPPLLCCSYEFFRVNPCTNRAFPDHLIGLRLMARRYCRVGEGKNKKKNRKNKKVGRINQNGAGIAMSVAMGTAVIFASVLECYIFPFLQMEKG